MLTIKQENSITVITESGFHQVFLADFPYYNAVLEAVATEDEDKLRTLATIYKQLTDKNSVVTVTDNGISVNGVELDAESKIAKFIHKLRDAGIVESQIDYIKPYIKNMFENPYIDAVDELYDFCEAQDFAITEDGCFLAYKKVRHDFTSIHDGRTRHDVGLTVKENYFDTDRTQTCSKGLHFCARGYLDHFGGRDLPIVVVKVNPRDVVAIPVDYNNMKGRCRQYEVIDVLKGETIKEYYRRNYA